MDIKIGDFVIPTHLEAFLEFKPAVDRIRKILGVLSSKAGFPLDLDLRPIRVVHILPGNPFPESSILMCETTVGRFHICEATSLIQKYVKLFHRPVFQVGDRVTLVEDFIPPPNADHGWSTCSHFLKSGESATVKIIEHDSYLIKFDNESWIDTEGKIRPVTKKHVFNFREHQLKLIDNDTQM